MATVMVKYLKSAMNGKFSENSSHVLLDTGTEGSFLNKNRQSLDTIQIS